MADFNWFIDNYQDLFNKYGHKFLAIKNKQVIGVFNSFTLTRGKKWTGVKPKGV